MAQTDTLQSATGARMGGTGRYWGWLRAVICVLVSLYLLVPLVVVIIISFSSAPYLTFPPPGFSLQWYENMFGTRAWMRTLTTSVQILIPTAIIATLLGTAAAYGLARSNMRGKPIIMGFLLSPIVVPVIITAAGIYGVFRGFGLTGTLTGLIVAHTVLTVPFVVATVSSSLKVMDWTLEDCARTLGARPFTCFRRVTLPLILPSVLSGMLFAMVISFDELIVSLFISSPRVRPVTVQMWSNVRGEVDPTIAAVAMLLFLFSLTVLLIDHFARRYNHAKKSEAGF